MKIRSLLTALVLVILAGGCDQVNFTAPTGSMLTIAAQPPTVGVNGSSTITVTGTRSTGAPLPDGTVITFTTNLGSIEPNPAETRDGVVTVRFRAGTRSGTAQIIARSGDAATDTLEIVIGEARASRLILTATPRQLPVGGGKVNIRANVVDESGNSLSGVGVIFSTNAGTLDSHSRVIRTNDSGLATDILRTTIAASVTAETLSGLAAEDTVEVTIGEGVPCAFEFSPPDPIVGQNVFFTDTIGNASGLQFLWDFGDGTTDEGQFVAHSFSNQGGFNVVHTVVDSQGFSSVCSQVVTVVRGEPNCDVTVDDANPTPGQQVVFNAENSSDTDGIIVSYTWNFHDGTAIVTQASPIISHSFANEGTFTVELTVTDDDGLQSVCTVRVFVDNNN